MQKVAELAREVREQVAKAEEIENAVYDLKTVNSNAKRVRTNGRQSSCWIS